jgi:hypothetical protein
MHGIFPALQMNSLSGGQQRHQHHRKRMESNNEGTEAFRSHLLSDQIDVDADTTIYDKNTTDSERDNIPFGSNIDPVDISASASNICATAPVEEGLSSNPFYGYHPPPYYNPYFHPLPPFPPVYAPVYPWPYPPPPILPGMTAPYPPMNKQYYPPYPHPYHPPPHPQSEIRYTAITASVHPSDRSEDASRKGTRNDPHQFSRKDSDHGSEPSSNNSAESKPQLAIHHVPNPGCQSMPIVVAIHPDQQLPQQPVSTFESFASSETDQREQKNMRSRSRAARLKVKIEAIKAKSPTERTQQELTKLATFEERRLRKNRKLREKAQEKKQKFEQIRAKTSDVEEMTKEEQLFLADVQLKKRKKSDADKSRRSRQKDSDGISIGSSTSLSTTNTNHAYISVPPIRQIRQHITRPYLHETPNPNRISLQQHNLQQQDPLTYYGEAFRCLPPAALTASSSMHTEQEASRLRAHTGNLGKSDHVSEMIEPMSPISLKICPSIFDRSPP